MKLKSSSFLKCLSRYRGSYTVQDSESKMLVQFQAELVDIKVDLSVSKAISQAVEQMINLRNEIHRDMAEFRQEIRQKIAEVKGDIIAIKTRLGMTLAAKDEVQKRWIEYCFKTAWLIGFAVTSYLLGHSHFF